MLEYIPCYGGPAEHWGLLPATRLASREILIEQNIKKQTGPALCVLCEPDTEELVQTVGTVHPSPANKIFGNVIKHFGRL
jgi:hypothetical protein